MSDPHQRPPREAMNRLPSLGRRGEGWVIIQVVLFVIVIAAGLTEPSVTGAVRGVLAVVGAILVGGGALLAGRGLLDLDTARTPLPHPRDGAELVASGSYALVRHPIYGGLVIAAAGWALLTASVLALGATALLLGFFRLKSAREESWLRDRYPDYGAYAARTRRLLPFIY